MAETLMSGASDALISLALKTLISEIRRVYGENRAVKKELDKLTQKLSLIQDVLEDAEQQQFQKPAVQEWLWRLRDVAYEAEDILDEWATKAQKQDHESQSRITQPCKCILPLFKLKFRWYMAKKIKEIKEGFVEIKEQSAEFHLMERVARTRKEVGECSRDPTDSLVDSSKIWGREEDKENMVKLLLNDINYEKDIFVLPIVGMGGLGKTTLAKLVYNDPRVVGHFNLKMWVCVSENFELIRLASAIFQSATGTKSDLVELDPLQISLRDQLKEKKLLLVLDDVWNGDRERWHRLKGILNCSKGSAIIVTTRSVSIASMMGSSSQYYPLEGLSNDYCWSLFEQCAFGGESGKESQNLVAIGKQIVKKCGGLPLAVNALGSLLSSERDEREWEITRDNEILKLPNDENKILPALRLSYDHLPFQLRRCFAYCSIFPKDYEINKENLIYLWIANDFILPTPSMELEEVGNKIFNKLVQRSLLQVEGRDDFGKIISCKMHDLLHDLARYVTGSEFFTLENAGEADGVPKETRHVFFDGNIIHKSLYDAHKVRGLFLTTNDYGGSLDLNQIVNLRLLRWLDLNNFRINEMPSSIDNLFHLRYLDLSWNNFTTLPESVSDLQNLQTLILRFCRYLTVLPKDTRKMSKLRHLDITGCNQLMAMPNKIGQLIGLRKLPTFVVGEGSDCGISQLGGMNFIRGRLSIMRLERVKNGMHPQGAKLLFNKKNLRVLKLSWNEGLDDGEAIKSEETLNSLQPCEKLEELEIFSYPGNQFSSWLQASLLPNLLRVYLEECNNCQSLPPLGQLPCLKHLSIKNMHAVKRIGVDFYGEDKSKSSFPLLQEFTLEGMDNLEEWSFVEDRRKVFPCLNKLVIANLTKLSYFPEGHLRNCIKLKSLQLKKCQKLRTLGRDLDSLVTLESLTIDSCDEMECLSEEGIRGLSCLRELFIMSCSKLTTISSVLEELHSLKTLEIHSCKDLMSLPGGIGKLIHLKSLTVNSCTRLTSFPQEGIGGLTSLQTLTLKRLPNLTSLPEGIGGLVSLVGLSIGFCSKLSILPATLQRLTSLKIFLLSGVDNLDFLPDGGLPSLEWLEIIDCQNLTTSVFEEGVRRLTALKELKIISCAEVSTLPADLHRLTSLKKLGIWHCHNLISLSEEGIRGLTRLEVLEIWDCSKLSSLPAALQQLTSLKELKIRDCENLTSLPEEGVRGLTALEVLDLQDCSKLSKLPAALQQLTSLREMRIWECENLTSLPEEGVRGLTALEVLDIRGCSKLSKLPAALQQLTIRTLNIRGCHPELITQVERKTGEEWLKIAHIPNIRTTRPYRRERIEPP